MRCVFISPEGYISWHNNANASAYVLILLGRKLETDTSNTLTVILEMK